MMSRTMHGRAGGTTPARPPLPVLRSTEGGAAVLAAVLAPGLQAAFDGCLDEVLPADLSDLLGRLDRAGATHAGMQAASSRKPGRVPTPDSFKRS